MATTANKLARHPPLVLRKCLWGGPHKGPIKGPQTPIWGVGVLKRLGGGGKRASKKEGVQTICKQIHARVQHHHKDPSFRFIHVFYYRAYFWAYLLHPFFCSRICGPFMGPHPGPFMNPHPPYGVCGLFWGAFMGAPPIKISVKLGGMLDLCFLSLINLERPLLAI